MLDRRRLIASAMAVLGANTQARGDGAAVDLQLVLAVDTSGSVTRDRFVLQRDGYVSRMVYPTVPPSVEYALTDLGKSLLAPLEQLVQWSANNHNVVRAARIEFDQVQ